MINNGVPHHIVQKYLGHDSPTMTQIYAHIHDQTLKEEIAKYHYNRVVNVTGEVVESTTPELDNNLDLHLLKKKVLAQSLPNGSCARPIVLGECPHANACLTCGDFRTTFEFLDQHKAQLEETENNERVSFGAIARIANVSVSYLYKYPEIKERIQDIRNQQVKNARKLTRPQTASEKSKQVFIKELRSRINTLEWEKKELKKQNEKMTGELYRVGTKLDLFDRVNSQAIRQASEIKQLKLDQERTRKALYVCKSKLIENNPKHEIQTLISKKLDKGD